MATIVKACSILTHEEEHMRLTLEALADVDTDCVIDHQAVEAWVDSLGTDAPLSAPHGDA
ncbi:hypothetical protein [Pseudomonas peradeniyensis]|uniref:CopG family transcriptional regulator n=1 Tax=Pseudomonas peradeniyensis TaxID=2745488 RepID=A0ABT2V7B6_9PSED|nr:hypothetical protein [Pseudomonas peradeniyensis]MCU7237363.1 hypothetical protein [Pseudomonas peradeniyensis]